MNKVITYYHTSENLEAVTLIQMRSWHVVIGDTVAAGENEREQVRQEHTVLLDDHRCGQVATQAYRCVGKVATDKSYQPVTGDNTDTQVLPQVKHLTVDGTICTRLDAIGRLAPVDRTIGRTTTIRPRVASRDTMRARVASTIRAREASGATMRAWEGSMTTKGRVSTAIIET